MGTEAITVGPGHEREVRWDGKGEYCKITDLIEGALDLCSKSGEQLTRRAGKSR